MAAAAPAPKPAASFAGQTVVILGATGYVGSGAAQRFLESGARVIAVGRDATRLEKLKTDLGTAVSKDNYDIVIGDFSDEKSAAAAVAALQAKVKTINHVISNMGGGQWSKTGITGSTPKELSAALDEGVWNTFNAARLLAPLLKEVKGASYTFTSGGLAHGEFKYGANAWPSGVRSAIVNNLAMALAKEFENDALRVNVLCLHFAIGSLTVGKNQFGWEGPKTFVLASVLLALASGAKRGQVVCATNPATIQELAQSLL